MIRDRAAVRIGTRVRIDHKIVYSKRAYYTSTVFMGGRFRPPKITLYKARNYKLNVKRMDLLHLSQFHFPSPQKKKKITNTPLACMYLRFDAQRIEDIGHESASKRGEMSSYEIQRPRGIVQTEKRPPE